jgi:peptide/nickel transport system permease protein
MLILVLSVKLRWLPPSGYGSVRQLIMPAVALGTSVAATIARLTRSSMLDVIQQDYIRTARAKGLGEWIVVYRHALRNALIPVVTLVGLQVGTLLGGAIVTETVFAWPGVGRLLVESISDYDFPTVQACVFVIALTFVLVNLLVDILYHYIDPRIRTG